MSEWFKEPVLKTGDSERGRGFESHLLRYSEGIRGEIQEDFAGRKLIWIEDSVFWRSTQEAEGTPLERVQVVNSGARVQIPPSPLIYHMCLTFLL